MIVTIVVCTCGGCEITEEDLLDTSYCYDELTPGYDGTLYTRCYHNQDIVVLLSIAESCIINSLYCDHHGRGCAPDGGCLCDDSLSGATCRRYPIVARNKDIGIFTIKSPAIIVWIVLSALAVIYIILIGLVICCCLIKKECASAMSEEGSDSELDVVDIDTKVELI